MAAYFARNLGPLFLIRVVSVIWTLCCVGVIISNRAIQIVLCKIGKGIAVGTVSVCAPMYVFEIMSTKNRASAIAGLASGAIFGQVIIMALGFILQQKFTPWASFHFTWIGEACLGVVTLCSALLLPELPLTSCRRGLWKKGKKLLEKLLQNNQYDMNKSGTTLQLRFTEMCSLPIIWAVTKAVLILIIAQVACWSMSGFFAGYVSALCGLPNTEAMSIVISQHVLLLLASFSPIILLKPGSRKDYLFVGYFFLTICYVVMTILTGFYDNPAVPRIRFGPAFVIRDSPAAGFIAVSGIVVLFTSWFVHSISILYSMELLPAHYRVPGFSIAMSFSWMIRAVIEALTQMISRIDPLFVFASLAIICAVGVITVCFVGDPKHTVYAPGIPYPYDQLLANNCIPFVDIDQLAEENTEKNSSLAVKKSGSFKSISRNSSMKRVPIGEHHKSQSLMLGTQSSGGTQVFTADSQFPERNYVSGSKRDESLRSEWLGSLIDG